MIFVGLGAKDRVLWRRADSSCWRSRVFSSGFDLELVIRNFMACTPAKGRVVVLLGSSRMVFASISSNGSCDTMCFACCTFSISTDGDDADMDRGEDDDDDPAAGTDDAPDALSMSPFFLCDLDELLRGVDF